MSLSASPEATALWEILLLSGADVSAYGHETRTEASREACFQEWLQRGSAEGVVEAVRELRRDYDQACEEASVSQSVDPTRVFICPTCGRLASVPESCKRPICLHSWDGNAPEVWDGDDTNGDGRKIEESLSEGMRVPGPNTWAQMIDWPSARAQAWGERED